MIRLKDLQAYLTLQRKETEHVPYVESFYPHKREDPPFLGHIALENKLAELQQGKGRIRLCRWRSLDAKIAGKEPDNDELVNSADGILKNYGIMASSDGYYVQGYHGTTPERLFHFLCLIREDPATVRFMEYLSGSNHLLPLSEMASRLYSYRKAGPRKKLHLQVHKSLLARVNDPEQSHSATIKKKEEFLIMEIDAAQKTKPTIFAYKEGYFLPRFISR